MADLAKSDSEYKRLLTRISDTSSFGQLSEARLIKQDLLAAVYAYHDVHAKSVSVPSIQDLAIAAFKSGVWDNQLIYQKTRDELLAWATAERAAPSTSTQSSSASELRPTIIAVAGLSRTLCTWESISEPYLELLEQYYTDASAQRLSAITDGTQTAGEYVTWILQSAEEEDERGDTCLSGEVARQAARTVRKCAATEVIPAGELPPSAGSAVVPPKGGSWQYKVADQPALDAAMDCADPAALGRLYTFALDTQSFKQFAQSLQDHILVRFPAFVAVTL